MAQFSDRLRELRQSVNLSQQKLAERLGLSTSSVKKYELGDREPKIEMLEAIADFFNVDLDYLVGKSDCPNSYLDAITRESLSGDEKHLLEDFRDLDDNGQTKLLGLADDMAQLARLKKRTEPSTKVENA